jgi:hypothetical protein
MKPFQYLLLALIIFVAGVIRYQYNTLTLIDTPVRGDAAHYVAYANNLIHYKTFSRASGSDERVPDSYWSPGYPLFLAGNILLADLISFDPYKQVLLSQALLGTMTVAAVFMLARISMPVGWALFATALMALSPHAISMGSYLLTETLFSLLMTLGLLFLAISLRDSRTLMAACTGVVFAAAYMVNPASLFIEPAALVVFILLNAKHSKATAKNYPARLIFVLLAPLLLVVVAWSVRTAISVPEKIDNAEDRLLTNLTIGMYRDFYDVWRANPRDPNNPATLTLSKINGSYEVFFSELTDRFRREPAAMLRWYLIEKPLLLWDWDIRVGQGDIYVYPVVYSLYHISNPALVSYSVMHAAHGWLIFPALAAIIFVWLDRQPSRWLAGTVWAAAVYMSAVYVITQAEPRYSVPLRPLLYIAAAYSMSVSYAVFRAKKVAQLSAG